jgi:hypothetical protein
MKKLIAWARIVLSVITTGACKTPTARYVLCRLVGIQNPSRDSSPWNTGSLGVRKYVVREEKRRYVGPREPWGRVANVAQVSHSVQCTDSQHNQRQRILGFSKQQPKTAPNLARSSAVVVPADRFPAVHLPVVQSGFAWGPGRATERLERPVARLGTVRRGALVLALAQTNCLTTTVDRGGIRDGPRQSRHLIAESEVFS